MYSGTMLSRYSGRVFGAHQKIDRIARRHLNQLCGSDVDFPAIRSIIHFEGQNGPDGIKRKSPAQDEPWHFYNPFDEADSRLLEIIQDHYQELVKQLQGGGKERAAFEAAWLAHAMVDGLTPAHHYPYEEKLLELMSGENMDSRNSVFKKNIMPGHTSSERLSNNWKMWGAKGLIVTHGMFEFGVASLIAPLSFGEMVPTSHDIEKFQTLGLVEWYKRTAREIAVLDMYRAYYQKGWTPKLAYQVRHKLGPALLSAVTLAWHGAVQAAEKNNSKLKVKKKS